MITIAVCVNSSSSAGLLWLTQTWATDLVTLNNENLFSQDWRLRVLTLRQHVTALPLKAQEKALSVSSSSCQFQALLGSWLHLSPLFFSLPELLCSVFPSASSFFFK